MIRPLCPQFLRYFLEGVRSHNLPSPVLFRMSPLMYADLRKFGRDELYLNTSTTLLKMGFWATWDTMEIWVSKLVPQFVFLAEDADRNVVAHESVHTILHPGSLVGCTHPKCAELYLEQQALEVLET